MLITSYSAIKSHLNKTSKTQTNIVACSSLISAMQYNLNTIPLQLTEKIYFHCYKLTADIFFSWQDLSNLSLPFEYQISCCSCWSFLILIISQNFFGNHLNLAKCNKITTWSGQGGDMLRCRWWDVTDLWHLSRWLTVKDVLASVA